VKSDTCNHANKVVSFECYRWYHLNAMISYALRLAGHQSPAPCCAGWARLPIILLKVLDTTPILKPPCLVISHKENAMSLMYKDESSSHHRLTSYPYPRKTYHNDH